MTFIKIHLYLSGVTLIFLSFMALSGSLHLLKGGEKEEVIKVQTFPLDNLMNKDQLTQFFSEKLKEIDANYSYELIKGSESSQMTRPTTRTYYTIKVDANQALIQKHIPTIRKKLMELHQGHGPRISRNILGALGLLVIGSVLSGLWLGWSSPALRKVTIATVLSGALLYFSFFLA